MKDSQNNEQDITTQHIENIVEIDGGKMFTTSLIVAEAFEKEHKDVLKAISNLECSKEFHERNFAPMVYEAEIGSGAKREFPAYRLTRDGFAFLAMGFTGKKAAAWKEKFLAAFNAMEKALRRQVLPIPLPPSKPQEEVLMRKCKLLRGFTAYWAFVEKIPLVIAEFIVCARFRKSHLSELTAEQQNEASEFVYFLINHPAYAEDDQDSEPEQVIMLRNMLTACSQFRHTLDWDLERDFEDMSGVSLNELPSLSPHAMQKMLSLAGCLLHRVFQRTRDWNYLLKMEEQA